jgi:hypothetical protein
MLALSALGRCGREGVSAAAAAFGNSRHSQDTLWLQRTTAFATTATGSAFFGSLLDVAADKTASDEARVVSMLTLLQMESVRRITLYDVTGGFEKGSPAHGCSGRARAEASASARPQLTDTDRARIRDVARQVRADRSAALDIQTAAACLGG